MSNVNHAECGRARTSYATVEAIVTRGLGLSMTRFHDETPRLKMPQKRRAGRPRTTSKPLSGSRAA